MPTDKIGTKVSQLADKIHDDLQNLYLSYLGARIDTNLLVEAVLKSRNIHEAQLYIKYNYPAEYNRQMKLIKNRKNKPLHKPKK